MAHAQSSQGDESQSNRYSLFCDPLSVHNSTVHTSDSSSASRFFGSQGLDFPEKIIEGLSAYSGCSSSYPAEGSPSRWQLSNPNSDLHFVSSNESSEKSTLINSSVAQLHIPQVQCTSSNFTWNNFHNGGWQQSPNPTISYISQISSVLPPSSFLALPSEATGTPVMLEGAMLRELLGRLGNSHCISNVSSLETTLATGSAQRLGSPMAAGCSWNHQVDASCNIGLTVDLSNGGLTHQGTGLAVSHGLAQFSSDPGFAERAARLSSFSNISQLSQPPLVTSSGMNLSPEASHFVDKSSSAIQASITPPSGPTPQSSPKVIRYQNASNEFSIWENAGKMDSVHDLVPMGETEAEDAGDIKRYKSATCHHSVVAIDETKSLPNSASPANSSGSGPYSAMCGLISSKGLVVDTLGMKQQKCISGDKAKEISCLSENSKQKMDEVRSKRQKTSETSKVKEPKLKVERSSSENSGNSSPSSTKENTKPPEPPKLDYIHVRARRGQATDSHSLAERVRREKISERMKFLQDLVPGCSKVTGKALMLDEIINYVQSLQRQVEFLSMKLAAVNPRLDFNFESLLSKEMLSSLCPSPTLLLGADNSTNLLQLHTTQQNGLQLGLSCGLILRPSGTPVENNFQRSRRSPVAVDTYASSGSQASGVWDGELQSVVQMGFGSGSFPSGQMKVEL